MWRTTSSRHPPVGRPSQPSACAWPPRLPVLPLGALWPPRPPGHGVRGPCSPSRTSTSYPRGRRHPCAGPCRRGAAAGSCRGSAYKRCPSRSPVGYCHLSGRRPAWHAEPPTPPHRPSRVLRRVAAGAACASLRRASAPIGRSARGPDHAGGVEHADLAQRSGDEPVRDRRCVHKALRRLEALSPRRVRAATRTARPGPLRDRRAGRVGIDRHLARLKVPVGRRGARPAVAPRMPPRCTCSGSLAPTRHPGP